VCVRRSCMSDKWNKQKASQQPNGTRLHSLSHIVFLSSPQATSQRTHTHTQPSYSNTHTHTHTQSGATQFMHCPPLCSAPTNIEQDNLIKVLLLCSLFSFPTHNSNNTGSSNNNNTNNNKVKLFPTTKPYLARQGLADNYTLHCSFLRTCHNFASV